MDQVKKIGDLKDREVFMLVRKKTVKTDELLLLVPGRFKEVISGPIGWTDDILKIWAGKPADKGLETLQKELFKSQLLSPYSILH